MTKKSRGFFTIEGLEKDTVSYHKQTARPLVMTEVTKSFSKLTFPRRLSGVVSAVASPSMEAQAPRQT